MAAVFYQIVVGRHAAYGWKGIDTSVVMVVCTYQNLVSVGKQRPGNMMVTDWGMRRLMLLPPMGATHGARNFPLLLPKVSSLPSERTKPPSVYCSIPLDSYG